MKVKNEELQNVIKNYVPENFGLKFESDSKTGEYDIILDITSFRDLIKEGWLVKYNKEEGKQKYLKKKMSLQLSQVLSEMEIKENLLS